MTRPRPPLATAATRSSTHTHHHTRTTAHAPPHTHYRTRTTHTHTHTAQFSHTRLVCCGAFRSDSLCILSAHQRRYLTRKLAEYLKEHCATNLEQVRTCHHHHQSGPPWHDPNRAHQQGTTWPALEWLTFVYIPKLVPDGLLFTRFLFHALFIYLFIIVIYIYYIYYNYNNYY
jgi:hypothetical protein